MESDTESIQEIAASQEPASLEKEKFETELYDLKEEFYDITMQTPPSLEQEPLIAFILKDDLIKIGEALRIYITKKQISIPTTSVSNIFKKDGKEITEDIYKYASNRQSLIKKMIARAIEIIDNYSMVSDDIKIYYINSIFYKNIWNITAPSD
jgi:hypothetical protein